MINRLTHTLASRLDARREHVVASHITVIRTDYTRPMLASASASLYSLTGAKDRLKAWIAEGPREEKTARSSLVKQLFDKNIPEKYKPRLEMGRLVIPESLTLKSSLISALPSNMTVEGNLVLTDCKNLESIPSGLHVKGNFSVNGGEKLTGLTPMVLGGDLSIRDSHQIEDIPRWIAEGLSADRSDGSTARNVTFLNTELSSQAHGQIGQGQQDRTARGDSPLRYYIDSERDDLSRRTAYVARPDRRDPYLNVERHTFWTDVSNAEDLEVMRSNRSPDLGKAVRMAWLGLCTWAENGPGYEVGTRRQLVDRLFDRSVSLEQMPRMFDGQLYIPHSMVITSSSISELPSNMKVDGHLCLFDLDSLEAIPRGLSVRGDLVISHSPNLRTLRPLRELNGDLCIAHSGLIQRLPEWIMDLPREVVDGASGNPRNRQVEIVNTRLSAVANNQITEYVNRTGNSESRIEFVTDRTISDSATAAEAAAAEATAALEAAEEARVDGMYDDLPEYRLTPEDINSVDSDSVCVLSQEDVWELKDPAVLCGPEVSSDCPKSIFSFKSLLRAHSAGSGCPVESGTRLVPIVLEHIHKVDKNSLRPN